MSGTDTDKGKDGSAAVAAALAALERAPAGPKLPAGGLTTEYVQAVLEENQCLILAVVDSLRACKTADCAAFQKRLNTNLLWLASIADKQHKAKAAAAGAGPTKAAAAAAASAKKAKPKAEVKYWTDAEHELFLEAYEKYGKDLPRIAEHVGTRTSAQVRSHMQKWLIREEKKRKRANAEQLMAGPTTEGMAVADDGAPTVTVNAALLQ
eukprot:PRCOL_00004621-RA